MRWPRGIQDSSVISACMFANTFIRLRVLCPTEVGLGPVWRQSSCANLTGQALDLGYGNEGLRMDVKSKACRKLR